MLQKIQTPLLGLCPLSGTMWILRRKNILKLLYSICLSEQTKTGKAKYMYLDAISLGKWITTSQDKQMFLHEKNLWRKIYYIVTKKMKNNLVEWCDVRAIAIAGALSSMMESNWMSLKWKLFWSQNLRCLKHDWS